MCTGHKCRYIITQNVLTHSSDMSNWFCFQIYYLIYPSLLTDISQFHISLNAEPQKTTKILENNRKRSELEIPVKVQVLFLFYRSVL